MTGSHDIIALFVQHFCHLFSGDSGDSGWPSAGSGVSGLSNAVGFDLLTKLTLLLFLKLVTRCQLMISGL